MASTGALPRRFYGAKRMAGLFAKKGTGRDRFQEPEERSGGNVGEGATWLAKLVDTGPSWRLQTVVTEGPEALMIATTSKAALLPDFLFNQMFGSAIMSDVRPNASRPQKWR